MTLCRYQWGAGLKLADLEALEKAHPGTFTLATEACLIKSGIAETERVHDSHGTLVGSAAPGNGTVAYTYASGELYALDILGDLHYGASGWVVTGPTHIPS